VGLGVGLLLRCPLLGGFFFVLRHSAVLVAWSVLFLFDLVQELGLALYVMFKVVICFSCRGGVLI